MTGSVCRFVPPTAGVLATIETPPLYTAGMLLAKRSTAMLGVSVRAANGRCACHSLN